MVLPLPHRDLCYGKDTVLCAGLTYSSKTRFDKFLGSLTPYPTCIHTRQATNIVEKYESSLVVG